MKEDLKAFAEHEREEDEKGVQIVNLSKEVKNSFLEYAMSVIVARALPDVKDGLKPVHRRILYGMSEAKMNAGSPYKKSARIVGDVMGKYHPHGDSAIYGAMVRLAQNFSTRYPLVDGHGNFGSIDGDGAAAMRYTEARMSKIAMEMVRDLDEDTVDFMPNYDGEEQEPVVLPSKFPNILVNGSTGIAVGMATNIPPHNLAEAIDAILTIAENPDIEVADLMQILKGPDFPTGAYILGKSGIKKAYETGNGTILLRSKTHIEEMANGKNRILITEIPYQVNKTVMIEKIADLAREKIIDGITDLRDESSGEDIRVVIELRKDVVPEVVLNQLFKLTQLQVSYGINMLALVDGEHKVLPVKEMLQYYLQHQKNVIYRRTQFELKKAEDELHVLQGIVIAIENIDEVIQIIRSSKNVEESQSALMDRFHLSERQAKAIVSMSLGRLSALEIEKSETKCKNLEEQVEDYKAILSSEDRIFEIVKNELIEIKNKYSDARRSEIIMGEFNIDDEDLITKEDIIVTLTLNGYIKRVPMDTFKTQNRGGKGIKGMATNEEDVVDKIVIANTHKDIIFFTNFGKVYRLRGHQIPEYGRTAKGIPVINLLNMDANEKVRSIISLNEYQENHTLVFVTKNGIVKRVALKEFESIRQKGKIAIHLKEDDELIDVKLTDGTAQILIASSNGKVVRFNEQDVRVMGRSASGVKGINVNGKEVVGVATSLEGEYLLVISKNGYGKMSLITDYRLTKRGSQGVLTMKISEKNGLLSNIKAVNGTEDLLVVTNQGIVIRTSLEQVKKAGRNTLGVRIIKLNEGQEVSSIAIAAKEEIIETEDEQEKCST
ncbi:MAG TPA: DNA gyrase subunit A [Candidatus Caccosoma faecigallinarum]|uniref:DNA gyrase subunit A n=1 Tax=Candidatus Caccosoma faecigallinarum TaxID=2840720 RepID=A0A9D1G892_9FIRM|nr:DNA gyrase subunit A [Candidatus Caccosoma faecigallinarum]